MATKQHITRTFSYPQKSLYNLVADVQAYPTFLPWCQSIKIIEQGEGYIIADLTVGHGLFRETFRSKVLLIPNEKIEVHYQQGPFKHLHNHWIFEQITDQETAVTFFIDFEFKSRILQSLMEKFFAESTNRLMTAFENKIQEREIK